MNSTASPSTETGTTTAVASTATAVMANPQISNLPLVDRIVTFEPEQRVVADSRMDPTSDPFLTQHLYKKRPILPAVISMSAVAQTASLLGTSSEQVMAIRNVELLEPMRFFTDRISTVQITAEVTPAGIECVVSSDFFTRTGKLVQEHRPYMRAVIDLGSSDQLQALTAPMPPDPEDPEAFSDLNYPHEGVLFHGEVFRGLKEFAVDPEHAWGRITTLDPVKLGGSRSGTEWWLPASAVDAAFYTCGVHVRETIPGVAKIPKSLDRLRTGRSPRVGETLLAFSTCRDLSESEATYDFTIYGDDGSIIVMVEGYHGVFVPRLK